MEKLTQETISDAMAKEILEAEARKPVTGQIIGLYMVRDRAAAHFTDPRFFLNNAVAFRQLESEFPGSRYEASPDDFAWHQVGTLDLATSKLTDMEPAILVECAALVPSKDTF